MNIYHYNSDGFLVGASEADESPLEPGVFLIPAMATETVPPNVAEGMRVRFDGGAWVVESIPEPEPAPVPEPDGPVPPSVYTCSPWQIRKALNNQGLRQAVEDAVAASIDQGLKDAWEFAQEFRSDHPFVLTMGATLGKTEEETAQLIEYAATL